MRALSLCQPLQTESKGWRPFSGLWDMHALTYSLWQGETPSKGTGISKKFVCFFLFASFIGGIIRAGRQVRPVVVGVFYESTYGAQAFHGISPLIAN